MNTNSSLPLPPADENRPNPSPAPSLEAYEPPRLTPVGNLRDLLAGKSRAGSDFSRPKSLK